MITFYPACFKVLENLLEAFKCSIIADFMSTVFGFSIALGCSKTIFVCFTNFVFIFFHQIKLIVFFTFTRIRYFFSFNLVANDSKYFSF